MISIAVLRKDKNETAVNVTEAEDDDDFSSCGVNYLPGHTNKNETKKNDDNFSITLEQRYILAGVYIICSILSAILVSIFVDPLSR